MKMIKAFIVGATVIITTGCATAVSPVGNGALFTSVKGPVNATTSTGISKSGQSCATNILGLIAVGDSSISTAKEKADISKVANIDHQSTTVLGLFSNYCTIVEGE